MLLHSWFSLIWYATWPCSEKVEFWPTDPIPRVVGVPLSGVCGQNICYYVAAFMILFNLICKMTMLGWVGVSGQNICFHVAAFVILFNFICMFWKSRILQDILTPSSGSGFGRGIVCWEKYLLPCCCILDSLPKCHVVIIRQNALEISSWNSMVPDLTAAAHIGTARSGSTLFASIPR